MKRITFIAWVFATTFIGNGCSTLPDIDLEKEPTEKTLPPITSEGNNTFGCLINGEVFIAEHTPYGLFEYDVLTYGFYSDSTVRISAHSNPTKTSIRLKGLHTYGDKIGLFNKDLKGIYSTHYSDNSSELGGKHFYIIQNSNDSIQLLRNDKEVIAGTFKFTAVHQKTLDTVYITEGRFDIQKD